VVLLGLALGTSLALGGLRIGPVTVSGNSLLIPALIIGFVYIPYVARPIRGQVLTLSQRDFVDAARLAGASRTRIMAAEILPNLTSTILVFVPLILANAILLEAALSYLGAGVQPPNASWGTMMAAGIQLLPAALHLTLVPGMALVITVLSINLFADGLRDALDPHGTTKWRP
jgi:peptide/nickel transport system permease protein